MSEKATRYDHEGKIMESSLRRALDAEDAHLKEGKEAYFQAETPSDIRQVVNRYRHRVIYELVAMDTRTPIDILERFASPKRYMHLIVRPWDDTTKQLRYMTAEEIAKEKKKRWVVTTNGYLNRTFKRKTRIKDIVGVLQTVADNPNATPAALLSIYNTEGLWVMEPRNWQVSRSTQKLLLQTIMEHPNVPEFLDDRLDNLLVRHTKIAEAKAEERRLIKAERLARSQPQMPVVKVVTQSFDAEMLDGWLD